MQPEMAARFYGNSQRTAGGTVKDDAWYNRMFARMAQLASGNHNRSAATEKSNTGTTTTTTTDQSVSAGGTTDSSLLDRVRNKRKSRRDGGFDPTQTGG